MPFLGTSTFVKKMIKITQETIDQLKAQGKRTDYLEDLLLADKLKRAKTKTVDLFDLTVDLSLGLRELYPEEVVQMQIFGRVLDRKDTEILTETKPHLMKLYEREVQQLLHTK